MMSSPDDNHDASSSSKSGSKRHLEDSSSDDSQFTTNNNNNYENDSDLSGQSQTTSANNVVQNGTSSSRKAKKRKAKRAKERRGSKESALVGWNGAFPNLSSTHSLESNSDLEQQKRKRFMKQHSSSSASAPPPTPPPAAAAPAPAEESSNASGEGSSSKSSRKRAISSNAGSGSEQGGGDKKRLKKLIEDVKQQQVDANQEDATGKGGHNLRIRSKSLHELNTESPPRRMTRARSVCAAAAAGIDAADIIIDKSLLRAAKKEPETPSGSGNSSNNNNNNKTGAKTPTRRRSVTAVKLPATDEFYTLPFRYGWRRELVLRSNPGSSRHRGDVIFISPDGRKMRSREDIVTLLNGCELTIDHFCFQRQLQHAGEPYETVRQAQSAPSRRKSMLAAKKQQLELHHQMHMKLNPNFNQQSTAAAASATSTAVSGKRVPKPKVPKGASPPPEGWTSTMAVKGNARVLAASNGNSGSGSGSSAGNAARGKRGNQMKQSPKIAAVAAVQAKAQSQPQQAQAQLVGENKICVYCLQPIKEKLNAAFSVGTPNNNYICKRCVKPGSKAVALAKAGGLPTARGHANGIKKQDKEKEKEPIDENVNANANGAKPSPAAEAADGGEKTTEAKADADQNGGDGSGSGVMLEIGGEIELPGALPPDQLLSDDNSNRAGNKITAKPQEVVVINGRKALAIAGEPPRPRLQVSPREPDLEAYEKHYHPKRNSSAKEKRQSFIECIASGNQSCQVMLAVMKTLDLHDRVRMSNVCKTWAMIARDRSVWRTLKLRDTRINNWLFCLRDMARNRTRELDMMGVKMDSPKLRMEGDLRVLKSLRILRTDACEAEFIQAVIKRIPRLLELRATCTSRALNLANIEKMVDLRVLRIRMTEPKAGIVSLQPLQKLQHLRELSLRGINNMAQLELTQLQELTNLETLVLGSSRGMKIAVLGQQVLPNLKKLLHLRIENQNNNRSFSISELMDGLAAGGGSSVKRLELVNVNVDAAFSRQLADCKSVQELLLMPNFHNNTAYMMHYVIQAINENCDQLNVFRLGLTYELLRVTRALAMNNEKDCVPVALPIPGVPENDLLNESDEPIAYLPVDRLESILHHMMPQAWLTVAKVSQSETCNLKFPASPKSDTNGSLHI